MCINKDVDDTTFGSGVLRFVLEMKNMVCDFLCDLHLVNLNPVQSSCNLRPLNV